MVKLNEIRCEEAMKKVLPKSYHQPITVLHNMVCVIVLSYLYLSGRLMEQLFRIFLHLQSFDMNLLRKPMTEWH